MDTWERLKRAGDQSEEMCQDAIDQDPSHLERIRDLSDDLCLYALRQHDGAHRYIREDMNERFREKYPEYYI